MIEPVWLYRHGANAGLIAFSNECAASPFFRQKFLWEYFNGHIFGFLVGRQITLKTNEQGMHSVR